MYEPLPPIKHWQKKDKRSPPLTRLERLKMFGCILALVLAGFLLGQWVLILKTAQKLDEKMARWGRQYNLSSEQTTKIRKIEEDFHGRNSLLENYHTLLRLQEHWHVIADQLAPSDRERFLREQEGHQPPSMSTPPERDPHF